MSIFRVFRSVVLFMNVGLAILGVYGWIWRPFFRIGERSSPYWLVRLYSNITPTSVAIIAALFVIFWLFRWVAGIFSLAAGKGAGDMVGLLRIGLMVSAISMVPAWFVSHDHISSENYNSGNFNLLREESFGETTLMLVECTDPGQMSCRTVARQVMPIPSNPTPMPEKVVVVEGKEVVLQPNYIPTPTPIVKFGIEASSGDLGVKLGNDWAILATPAALEE